MEFDCVNTIEGRESGEAGYGHDPGLPSLLPLERVRQSPIVDHYGILLYPEHSYLSGIILIHPPCIRARHQSLPLEAFFTLRPVRNDDPLNRKPYFIALTVNS